MNKRGQVTLFIIIAIIIVAVALIAVFLWPSIKDKFMSEEKASQILASQAEPLRDAVKDCVSQVSLEIFNTIGSQAGYYTYEGMYGIVYADQPKVVIMYKDISGKFVNKLPSLEMISSEFNRALVEEGYAKIDKCLNNFDSFKKTMDVNYTSRNITAIVMPEQIVISIDWPIDISKKTVTQTILQKDAVLLIPLGNLWKVANDIVNMEMEGTKFEGYTRASYVTSNFNLIKYLVLDTQNYPMADTVLFMFRSLPYREGEKAYKFYFAIDRR